MAATRLYRFADLGLDGVQEIRHGTKVKESGEPYDQAALAARIRRASRAWKRSAAERARTKREARDIASREFVVERPSAARVVIRRTA